MILDFVNKFNEKYNIDKISGINWPPSKQFKGNKCCAILKSGKRKGVMCGCKCKKNQDKCGRHISKKKVLNTIVSI